MVKTALLGLALFCQAAAGAEVVRTIRYLTAEPPAPPVPFYDNGYLIFLYGVHDREIVVYGPKGDRTFRAVLTGADAGSLCPRSAAADTDGTIAVAAGCTGPPHDMGGGIALLDSTGRQIRFIRTGRYMPTQVTFGADHGIWVVGFQRDAEDVYSEDKQSYCIFREFSREGKQLREYVPRELFPRALTPRVALGEKSMAAARDRVGALLYGGRQGSQRMWVEFDFDGKLLGHWIMDDISVGNLGITYSGDLYQYVTDWKEHTHQLKVFDRVSASWNPVPGDFGANWALMGADGEDVVLWDQDELATKLNYVRPTR